LEVGKEGNNMALALSIIPNQEKRNKENGIRERGLNG
jgi:hypothetical protein